MAAAVAERSVKVLALLPFSQEAASVRFRVSQFLPFLAAAGFAVETQALIETDAFRLLYKRGHKLEKVAALVSSTSNRIRALGRSYDMAIIHREAYPLGQPLIERWLARRVPIVFDFDDAIYLQNASEANRDVRFLKRPAKTAEIITLSTEVIAGNPHLGEYASRFSSHVNVIPTCVDTTVWRPQPRPVRSGPPVIGWIGTPTTTPYLLALQPVFETLARETPFILRVSGSGVALTMPGVTIENVPWTLEREVELFASCDIGVYPMPTDEWTLGKCGFKAIQFMACAVPVVASPVGVNTTIIDAGVNGLLAGDPDDWLRHLRMLIADAAARQRLGMAGRQRIESSYSLHVHAPSVVEVFERASRVRRASVD